MIGHDKPMIDKQLFERISKRIDSYRDEMIDLQMALTAIPALAPENGGDGEFKKSHYIIDFLKAHSFTDIIEINAPDDRVQSGIRPNVIARVPGSGDSTVWVMTHTDVVPPGELEFWDDDPWHGYVKNGLIYGRGTEDNQQDLVASIFAAKAFIDEGIIPETDIALAFLSDEETGSAKGLEYLLEAAPELFRKADRFVVPDFGTRDGSLIEIAEKSVYWLRFKTLGRQCHASTPEVGINAFRAASFLVTELNGLHEIFDLTDPLYQPPISTFEPTRKEANVPNVNTIPGEDVFFFDCRVLPEYDLKDVLAEIKKRVAEIENRFNVIVEITPVQNVQAPSPTPEDAPVVIALKGAIGDVFNIEATCGGIGGGTVAAHLRMKGFQAAVWSKLGKTAHQANEYCIIDNMMGDAKVFAHLFLQR